MRFAGIKTCPQCGSTFSVDRPAMMSVRHYCSKRCAWDAKMVANPSDRTGRAIAERLHPGQPCEVCGMPYGGRGRVQRHHIDSDRSNNARSNIAFLCVKHHKDAHKASDGKVGGGPRPRVNALRTAKAIADTQLARAALAEGMSVEDVAAQLGVEKHSVYRWLRKYPEAAA